MSKAGKILLLTMIFLITSGVFTKSLAKEELTNFILDKSQTDFYCKKSLANIVVAINSTCNNNSTNQITPSTNNSVINSNGSDNLISYKVFPTYYIPPPQTTPTVTPEETIVPSIIPNALSQAPLNNVPAQSGHDLDANLIFNMINEYRIQIGKIPFQTDPSLCQLAKIRSHELYDELFVNHNLHSGLYNRHLPYWVTEDAKWGSNEAGTVQWWLHSPIHRAAIEGNAVYSCGACNGSMCSQLFTSYTPKEGINNTPKVGMSLKKSISTFPLAVKN